MSRIYKKYRKVEPYLIMISLILYFSYACYFVSNPPYDWNEDLEYKPFYTIDNLIEFFIFPEPGNLNMLCIVEMFYTTAQTMFYLLLIIIFIIWAIISTRNENIIYPRAVSRWEESLLDIGILFIPLIIIFAVTVPAVGFVLFIDRYLNFSESIFNMEVIGHQWYWSYLLHVNYDQDLELVYNIFNIPEKKERNINNLIEIDQIIDLDLDIEKEIRLLKTNTKLILPLQRDIKVLITSADVIHSWAIPALGIKQDAIPGRIESFILFSWYPATYIGQCSELCGPYHGFMPIVVEFCEESLFLDWAIKNSEDRGYKSTMANYSILLELSEYGWEEVTDIIKNILNDKDIYEGVDYELVKQLNTVNKPRYEIKDFNLNPQALFRCINDTSKPQSFRQCMNDSISIEMYDTKTGDISHELLVDLISDVIKKQTALKTNAVNAVNAVNELTELNVSKINKIENIKNQNIIKSVIENNETYTEITLSNSEEAFMFFYSYNDDDDDKSWQEDQEEDDFWKEYGFTWLIISYIEILVIAWYFRMFR